MKIYDKLAVFVLIAFTCLGANAGGQFIEGLTIKKLRAVGNYHAADTFDDTLEVWFTTGLTWSEDVSCTNTYRVYVDGSKNHMVSLLYMAFASGKEVDIFADDSLPQRSGSCEISYVDLNL